MSGWQRVGVMVSVLWVVGMVGAEYFIVGYLDPNLRGERIDECDA